MRISYWSSDVCSSDLFLKLGCRNVLITNPRDMKGFVAELKSSGFTAISGVNTLFNGLLNTPGFSELDFSKLKLAVGRSEEHTSELQSLMRISYAVFCLKKKNTPYDGILPYLHPTTHAYVFIISY